MDEILTNTIHTIPSNPPVSVTVVDSEGKSADLSVMAALDVVCPLLLSFANRRLRDKSSLPEIVEKAVHAMSAVLRSGESIENPRTYLYAAIKNGINWAADKEELDLHTAPEAFDKEVDKKTIDWESTLNRKILVEQLIESLDNETRRRVMWLRAEGHDYNYIARILNISVNGARAHFSQGLKLIRKYLNKSKKSGA